MVPRTLVSASKAAIITVTLMISSSFADQGAEMISISPSAQTGLFNSVGPLSPHGKKYRKSTLLQDFQDLAISKITSIHLKCLQDTDPMNSSQTIGFTKD